MTASGPPPVPGPPSGRPGSAGPAPARPAPVADTGAEPPLTPAVAAALARLDELDAAPVAQHVDVLGDVHRLLQDALATLDEV